jgi:hypothetical protein
VKEFLNPYNRMGDYISHLAHYMFAAGCRSDNADKFIGIVASMDCSTTPTRHHCYVAT